MIEHPSFIVEPWAVRETNLDLDVLAQSESVFALSNGHIGLRGNLDEGEPHGLPGTYLNSVYENRPLPYAEAGYGYPESGETVINVTNGKLIRLLVDDEPFDLRYGQLLEHERVLDFRSGTLQRTAVWRTPPGKTVRVRSTRLVSLTHRSVAAIEYEVEVDEGADVVIQSELVANEPLPGRDDDPRSANDLSSPLVNEETVAHRLGTVMMHRTVHSGLRVAAAMDHMVEGVDGAAIEIDIDGDVARVVIPARLEAGARLRVVKLLAYGWSGTRTRLGLHDQVVAALAGARQVGWEGLRRQQADFLKVFWDRADVEVDGDAQVQQAVRFGLFHIIQAAARAEQRPIPAKGLTGPGYDGHTFWDSESFVLPVLTLTHPAVAGDALRWRLHTLPAAEDRARSLGLRGAAFAWRTISGRECSGYWPAGTAAFHVNADIADAVVRYLDATEDSEFEEEVALPLLVATARLWRSLGEHDVHGRFRIDGVTGPDEYSAIADNNVYTNLLAQRNLWAAADVAARHREAAHRLGVSAEERASWHDAGDAMLIPYDADLGVHPQSDGFTDHARWDFDRTKPEQYPLMLHFPYFDLYRKQVTKQADLVLAMTVRPDAFTADEKRRNFEYYEAITVRDSSLSAGTQSVMAAEVGHLDLAHDYLGEAALMDLRDLEHNTKDGLHIASLAGAWTALVAGLAGMRAGDGVIAFRPRLPSGISGLRFNLRYRQRTVRVEIDPEHVTYKLTEGRPLRIEHYGKEMEMTEEAVTLPLEPPPAGPAPTQPAGRIPAPHHTRSSP